MRLLRKDFPGKINLSRVSSYPGTHNAGEDWPRALWKGQWHLQRCRSRTYRQKISPLMWLGQVFFGAIEEIMSVKLSWGRAVGRVLERKYPLPVQICGCVYGGGWLGWVVNHLELWLQTTETKMRFKISETFAVCIASEVFTQIICFFRGWIGNIDGDNGRHKDTSASPRKLLFDPQQRLGLQGRPGTSNRRPLGFLSLSIISAPCICLCHSAVFLPFYLRPQGRWQDALKRFRLN